MSVIWDLAQQRQINTAVKLVSKGREMAEDVSDDDAGELERRLDRLSIVTRAMWELISERFSISENELMSKMMEIDLRDGKADGKLRADAKPCISCGRNINKIHTVCLYCGESNHITNAFDGT